VNKYVSDAYVPTADDFRGFRRQVKEWRRIYEANYRAVRNQIFAHAEVSQPDDVHARFAKTNIQELEVLVTDLVTFHSRLQNLLQNGFRPTGDRVNSSVQALRKMSSSTVERPSRVESPRTPSAVCLRLPVLIPRKSHEPWSTAPVLSQKGARDAPQRS